MPKDGKMKRGSGGRPQSLLGMRIGAGFSGSAQTPTVCGTKTFTIAPDRITTFYGRDDYLSTFFPSPMLISGHEYFSVEHYYEACKLCALVSPAAAAGLKKARNSAEAKVMAKRIIKEARVPNHVQTRWKESDGLLVIRVGCLEKFRQNPNLRLRLFDSGGSTLVQSNQFDKVWANGMNKEDFSSWVAENEGSELEVPAVIDPTTVRMVPLVGKGKNLLGFLQMQVRECLRSEYGVRGPDAETLWSQPSVSSQLKPEAKYDFTNDVDV